MARGKRMIDIIALVLILVVVISFGQVLMKRGLKNMGGINLNEVLSAKLFSVIFEKNIFFGIVLYVISTLLWLVILSKVELSFAYPLIALGYVVTAILAKLFFNENITLMRWMGILLVLGGVFLISKT